VLTAMIVVGCCAFSAFVTLLEKAVLYGALPTWTNLDGIHVNVARCRSSIVTSWRPGGLMATHCNAPPCAACKHISIAANNAASSAMYDILCVCVL